MNTKFVESNHVVYTDSAKTPNGIIHVLLFEGFVNHYTELPGAYRQWQSLGVIGGCYLSNGQPAWYASPLYVQFIDSEAYAQLQKEHPDLDGETDIIKVLSYLLRNCAK